MKTAISIPDDVFDAADEMAKRLRLSRSQLYANAVREYLDAHRSRGVTARLDQVYENRDSPPRPPGGRGAVCFPG